MFVRSVFLIFASIAALGCGKASTSVNNATAGSPDAQPTPIQTSTPKKIELTKDVAITMERGACYGRCPQYTITITGDGKVVFDGKENTKVKGKTDGKLEMEEVEQILEEFEKIEFFDLDDKYDEANCPNAATDLPTVVYTVRVNGREKTVSHYTGCVDGFEAPYKPYPPGLLALGNSIHSIAESLNFVGPR